MTYLITNIEMNLDNWSDWEAFLSQLECGKSTKEKGLLYLDLAERSIKGLFYLGLAETLIKGFLYLDLAKRSVDLAKRLIKGLLYLDLTETLIKGLLNLDLAEMSIKGLLYFDLAERSIKGLFYLEILKDWSKGFKVNQRASLPQSWTVAYKKSNVGIRLLNDECFVVPLSFVMWNIPLFLLDLNFFIIFSKKNFDGFL